MRKSINRTTVLIVLAVFLTLSVGYALFSDTITIEGTATAKGNFDIEASCITDITPDYLYSLGITDNSKAGTTVVEEYKEHGYKDVSCGVSDDKISYSVSFDYPTAKKFYVIKMKNTGSIAATFDIAVFDDEKYNVNTVKTYNKDGVLIETDNNWTDTLFVGYVYKAVGEKADGKFTTLDNFLITDSETIVKFEPGESLYIIIKSSWPNYDDYFSENGMKYVATSTFELDWQQYTD